MKAILAIAAAHIQQEWKVALLALVAGLGALILAAIGVANTAMKVMAALAALGAPVAAVLLGLNLLGPEVRQRRLSFFFSRPCSPWQLWWGRLLGALVVLAVASIPLMGVVILGGPAVDSSPNAAARAWTLVIPLTVLLLATNAAICIIASPAGDAFLVDLAAVTAIAVSAYWSLLGVIKLVGSPGVMFGVGLAIPITAACALLPACLAYVWGGKGRAKWGHRWFSWTFWPIVGLSVIGINVWRSQEEKLLAPEVLRYPAWGRPLDENRVLISLWGKHPRWFVVDVRTGGSERALVAGGVVSRNGEFIGWVEYELPRTFPLREQLALVVARTAALREPLRRINVTTSPGLWDLSDDGESALCWSREGLEVRNTRTGELRGRLEASASPIVRARFDSDQSIEATVEEPTAFRLVRLAFDGSVLHEERLARPSGARLVEHALSGRRAIVEAGRTALYSKEGELLSSAEGANQSAFFTRDGRLLVTSRTRVPHPETQLNSIVRLEGDGSPPRALSGLATRPHLVGELSTGEIVVRTLIRGRPTSLLVDPNNLDVRATLEGFDSLGIRTESRARYSQASDTLLRVFQHEDGDLYFLDPGATKLRLLVKSTWKDF